MKTLNVVVEVSDEMYDLMIEQLLNLTGEGEQEDLENWIADAIKGDIEHSECEFLFDGQFGNIVYGGDE